MKTGIAIYVAFGIWTMVHVDAFQRHCHKPLPVTVYLSVGVMWPLAMVLIGIDDITSDTAFDCPMPK